VGQLQEEGTPIRLIGPTFPNYRDVPIEIFFQGKAHFNSLERFVETSGVSHILDTWQLLNETSTACQVDKTENNFYTQVIVEN
jgi:hypothetical protein